MARITRSRTTLHTNGTVYRPIHKIRTDAGGGYRPKDLPREIPLELWVKLRGIDPVGVGDYLAHALPHMIHMICQLAGISKHTETYDDHHIYIYI